jgi:DNA mismatch endonuclease (patch repair protein)
MGQSDTPPASSELARQRMVNQRQRDTTPEVALRRELHRIGLRFRVDRAPIPGIRRKADIVFASANVVVFVDGCFWHSCPEHGTLPKTNREWWRLKLEGNCQRDLDTDRKLQGIGWKVIRVWEHEDPIASAAVVAQIVRHHALNLRT